MMNHQLTLHDDHKIVVAVDCNVNEEKERREHWDDG